MYNISCSEGNYIFKTASIKFIYSNKFCIPQFT